MLMRMLAYLDYKYYQGLDGGLGKMLTFVIITTYLMIFIFSLLILNNGE